MKPAFFRTPEKLRAWLEKNHSTMTVPFIPLLQCGSQK